MPGPFEQIHCRSLQEAKAVLSSPRYARRASLERLLASLHTHDREYRLPGICGVDAAPVTFLVDRKWGASRLDDGTWLPNWRERLQCPKCGLNNRQRAIATIVLDDLDRRQSSGPCQVWLMEQLSPTCGVLRHRVPAECFVASEYVGAAHVSGTVVRGVRHEDAENTSFRDAALDVIVSNDVLEHVPHPKRAIEEAARILKPGGVLYFTIPFHQDRYATVVRAESVDDGVTHHLPPQYHGDPFSGGRSLVFTDFGWDVLDVVRSCGFADCSAVLYWSLEYGHLGGGNFLFVASR